MVRLLVGWLDRWVMKQLDDIFPEEIEFLDHASQKAQVSDR